VTYTFVITGINLKIKILRHYSVSTDYGHFIGTVPPNSNNYLAVDTAYPIRFES